MYDEIKSHIIWLPFFLLFILACGWFLFWRLDNSNGSGTAEQAQEQLNKAQEHQQRAIERTEAAERTNSDIASGIGRAEAQAEAINATAGRLQSRELDSATRIAESQLIIDELERRMQSKAENNR